MFTYKNANFDHRTCESKNSGVHQAATERYRTVLRLDTPSIHEKVNSKSYLDPNELHQVQAQANAVVQQVLMRHPEVPQPS
jgi:hypothetical protein